MHMSNRILLYPTSKIKSLFMLNLWLSVKREKTFDFFLEKMV